MEWGKLAILIDESETLISVFLVLFSFIMFRLNSTTITLFCWVVANIAMELTLTGLTSLNDYIPLLVRFAQYPIWIAFNVATLLSILKFHTHLNVKLSKYSYFVALTIGLLSLFQFIRLFDRLIIETNLFADIYRYGILSLNLGPAILALPIILPPLMIHSVKVLGKLKVFITNLLLKTKNGVY